MRARGAGRTIGPRRPQQPKPRRPNLPPNALDDRGPCDTVLPRRTGGTGRAIATGRPRRSRQARITRITCRAHGTSQRQLVTSQRT